MNETVRKVIRIIAALVLVASLAVLASYLYGDWRDAQAQRKLDALKGAEDKTVHNVLPEYSSLYRENDESIGWLKIDGTNIDNVVMYAPAEQQKYLHRDFYGEDSYRGCLFVDDDCDIDHSDNLIIYGHNMKDGSMFATLDYFASKDFYEEHKTFSFDTVYEKHTYEIIAAFKTDLSEDRGGFRYDEYTTCNDEERFLDYAEFIDKNKLYETEADELKFGDKLLTLSTCAYHTEDGRFAVVARQIK